MQLGDFVLSNSERIISEWETSARTCRLPADTTSGPDLRAHGRGILDAIALGLPPRSQPPEASWSTVARAHGTTRRLAGVTPGQMVAEFGALRVSVLRLWTDTEQQLTHTHLEDLSLFNRAVDQALAESIACYVHDLEYSKDVFLEIVGHDLRNPLAAIMMSATLMISTEEPTWPHAKTASRILNSGVRMERIIAELMDFTRCRHGAGIAITPVSADLEAICRHTIEEVVRTYPKHVVRLDVGGHLRGRWDETRMGQALSNVICHAVTHANDRTPVTITACGERDEVVVSVHHEGRVVPAAELPDLFNPLKSIGPDGKKLRDLSGLGLFIAKEIVVAHGGGIEVSSLPERGTTFIIRLPNARA
ncbi:MAG: sensor histidine kinase [Deltaproteobacteria bacterium]|nr:sensor histidine kinase [Deltaproteobacteria bacterium]